MYAAPGGGPCNIRSWGGAPAEQSVSEAESVRESICSSLCASLCATVHATITASVAHQLMSAAEALTMAN